jgi:hypothetical protein
VATNGATGSVIRSPSSAASRDRSIADRARADTNSPQANGRANGNVISRASAVARNVTITAKATAPTAASSMTLVSDHHVDVDRHGRSRSLSTPTR